MWILRTSEPPPPDGAFTFRITPNSIKTMGRAARADFVVDVALVSRFHCRFTSPADGSLFVEDLESTNGTFVNGKRMARAQLTQGDVVRVGRVELVVQRG